MNYPFSHLRSHICNGSSVGMSSAQQPQQPHSASGTLKRGTLSRQQSQRDNNAPQVRHHLMKLFSFLFSTKQCTVLHGSPKSKDLFLSFTCALFYQLSSQVERILKYSLVSIPSPSVKIQTMSGEFCLMCKGKTLLGVVNTLLKKKSLLTSPSNVLPYYLLVNFPANNLNLH